VEASTTRGTTALVYWQLNSSLYTSAVQGYWSTPNWSDRRQGCRQVSTGLPPSSGLGWEEQRSEVQPLWWCPLTGWVPRLWHLWWCWGPGRTKTSSPVRKTVPGLSRGGSWREGEETNGSENKTHLVAAGPPGCKPGGLPRQRGLPGVVSAAVQALRRLTATIVPFGTEQESMGWNVTHTKM
jgi:hypothetical protein